MATAVLSQPCARETSQTSPDRRRFGQTLGCHPPFGKARNCQPPTGGNGASPSNLDAARLNKPKGQRMSQKGRSLRIVGVLVAVVALMAAVASAAQADGWRVAGTEISSGVKQNVEGSNLNGGVRTPFFLSGTLLNKAVEIKCEEQGTSGGVIFNEGGVPKDEGKVTFKKCSIPALPACVVENITTNLLKTHLDMDTTTKVATSNTFDVFEPSVAGGAFATLNITECALASKPEVKGSVVGETNKTEVGAVEQPLTFSKAITEAENEVTTTKKELTLGGKVAFLSGKSWNKLITTNVGSSWDAK
jgi:hypothetical protein